jgi:Chibby family
MRLEERNKSLEGENQMLKYKMQLLLDFAAVF